MGEETTPPVPAERHAPKRVALHVRDTVVPGDPSVHEGEVGVDEIQEAAVLLDDRGQEHPRLGQHGIARVLELREALPVQLDGLQLVELQPLAGEVLGQGPRLRICKHA